MLCILKHHKKISKTNCSCINFEMHLTARIPKKFFSSQPNQKPLKKRILIILKRLKSYKIILNKFKFKIETSFRVILPEQNWILGYYDILLPGLDFRVQFDIHKQPRFVEYQGTPKTRIKYVRINMWPKVMAQTRLMRACCCVRGCTNCCVKMLT